jgi:hypothetical protein
MGGQPEGAEGLNCKKRAISHYRETLSPLDTPAVALTIVMHCRPPLPRASLVGLGDQQGDRETRRALGARRAKRRFLLRCSSAQTFPSAGRICSADAPMRLPKAPFPPTGSLRIRRIRGMQEWRWHFVPPQIHCSTFDIVFRFLLPGMHINLMEAPNGRSAAEVARQNCLTRPIPRSLLSIPNTTFARSAERWHSAVVRFSTACHSVSLERVTLGGPPLPRAA